MKISSICFLMIFLVIIHSHAQEYVPIINDSVLVEGVYKDFEEFKQNNPSLKINTYAIETYSDFYSADDIIQYYLGTSLPDKIKMNQVWGFSDGQDVFIKQGKGMMATTPLFNKITFFGRYCYFEVLKGGETQLSDPDYFGRTKSRVGVFSQPEGKIINLNNGKEYYLKNKIGAILITDKELYEEFKKDTMQRKTLIHYLIKYSDKHVFEIK